MAGSVLSSVDALVLLRVAVDCSDGHVHLHLLHKLLQVFVLVVLGGALDYRAVNGC